MGTKSKPKTLAEVCDWLAEAPEGTTIPAAAMLSTIEDMSPVNSRENGGPPDCSTALALTWRERLWLAPSETRIGTHELCEALGRSKHWLYRHTGPSAENRIPHRKLDGELVFAVGEVRTWIRENEDVIKALPSCSTPEELRLRS